MLCRLYAYENREGEILLCRSSWTLWQSIFLNRLVLFLILNGLSFAISRRNP